MISDLPEFARLLCVYLDRNGRSPDWLAQQLQLSPETVNAWLNGQGHPRAREAVIEMFSLFSIVNPKDQEALLRAAGHGSPMPPGRTNQTNFYGSIYGPVSTGSGNINVNPLSLAALTEWSDDFFHWPEAPDHMRSSWAGKATWALSALAGRMTPQGWFAASLSLVLWIVTAWAVTPFYQWPLADNEARLLACLQFAAATILVPLAVAAVTRPDYNTLIIRETWRQRLTLLLLKAAGALVGYGAFAGALLLVAMGVYYVTLGSLPVAIWWLLAAVPLLWSHIAARRIPADRYHMYGHKPQMHPADKLFLVAFLLFGPLLATFVYLWYSLLSQRWMAIVLLLVIAFIAWREGRANRR